MMRLLLDECVDERLRHLLSETDCQTDRFAGLAGLKNGQLLQATEAAGFDVLLTVDQNIRDQQNLAGHTISILILRGRSSRLRDLEPLVPAVLSALRTLAPGKAVRIGG
jgi:predicted nuclease of predicted toxin-antitoxin system